MLMALIAEIVLLVTFVRIARNPSAMKIVFKAKKERTVAKNVLWVLNRLQLEPDVISFVLRMVSITMENSAQNAPREAIV